MNRFGNFFRLINYVPIVALVSLILVLALWIGGIIPGFQKMREIRREISWKEAVLGQRQKHFSNLSAINEKLQDYMAPLANVEAVLPESPDIPSLFSYIQKTASQSGLFLEDLGDYQITEAADIPRIKEIAFGLKVSGSYPALKTFVSVLEKSARFLEIKDISLTQAEDHFSFDLNLRAFSY